MYWATEGRGLTSRYLFAGSSLPTSRCLLQHFASARSRRLGRLHILLERLVFPQQLLCPVKGTSGTPSQVSLDEDFSQLCRRQSHFISANETRADCSGQEEDCAGPGRDSGPGVVLVSETQGKEGCCSQIMGVAASTYERFRVEDFMTRHVFFTGLYSRSRGPQMSEQPPWSRLDRGLADEGRQTQLPFF